MAITSQENSAMWVGYFDFEALEFSDEGSQVYHFPRDNHCDMVRAAPRAATVGGRPRSHALPPCLH